ncbi:MAG TPA: endo-1,4-beta-xylanase [Steroidobacteraceae bacterium]|jgi:endo-1,4-beta-xylanase|nr:endo-1,4-beta-xylanase [Steroidobacteraceae bacterium]
MFKHTAALGSLIALACLAAPAQAQIANGKAKFVGNVIGGSVPGSFNTYWNQVTPENATKWGSVEGTRNSMNWSQADAAYNYAQSHGYKFKFHTLVWGAQYPGWLTSTGLTQAQQRAEIEQWITLAGQHFPNAWAVDVVNEPIKTANPWKAALGGNGTTGWDWVITSYQLARTAFPNAKLLINEYGTENDANARNQYKTIINLLKARGLIDGIGIQSHYFNVDSMNASAVTSMLNDYATLGLDVYVSELDIVGSGGDAAQLAKYQDVFPAFWNHASVKGITLWGYIVGQTWRDGTGLVTTAGVERPAMTWLKGFVSGSGNPPSGSAVWLEAERGTVGANWNDNVADSTASAGQYVVAKPGQQSVSAAPTTAAGWVQLNVPAPAAGTYNVWFRKKTPSADDDSFWIRMDSGGWTNWNGMGASSSWAWVKAPVTYTLSAGNHTFFVGLREDGAQLDKVYLTTGSDTPSGTGGTATN